MEHVTEHVCPCKLSTQIIRNLHKVCTMDSNQSLTYNATAIAMFPFMSKPAYKFAIDILGADIGSYGGGVFRATTLFYCTVAGLHYYGPLKKEPFFKQVLAALAVNMAYHRIVKPLTTSTSPKLQLFNSERTNRSFDTLHLHVHMPDDDPNGTEGETAPPIE